MSDAFDQNYCNKDFKFNINKSIVTKSSDGEANVFLTKVVDSGVHQWRFILKHMNGSSFRVVIGVWKTNQKMDTFMNLRTYLSKGKCYGYSINHQKLTFGDNNKQLPYGSARCKTGDTIDMILDLERLELSFVVNNTDYGIAHKVQKTSYRAVVYAYRANDSIQFVSYKNHMKIDSDDIKSFQCNKCEALKSEIALKNGIANSLQGQNEEMKRQISKLNKEKNDMNDTNIKLNEECKELRMDLNEMTQKYNTLFRKANIDESNYLEWDSDDITDWIINLHQQYEKYEDKLRENMKKEDVDGALLAELDKNDLHRLGIISLRDKKEIVKHIKRLTIQMKQQQLSQYNEGNDATAFI